MSALTLAAVISLATACVPADAHIRDRLVAHAMVESGLDPLALHDNTTNTAYRPIDETAAWVLASQLLASGHSVDGGIAQINSQHWSRWQLRGRRLVDAKTNLCVGAVILIQDYEAACRYNTGKPNCGGNYPAMVAQAMRQIEQRAETAEVSPESTPKQPDPCADVPSWDLWAMQECRERQHKERDQ